MQVAVGGGTATVPLDGSADSLGGAAAGAVGDVPDPDGPVGVEVCSSHESDADDLDVDFLDCEALSNDARYNSTFKRLRRHGSWFPDGPRTLHDVMNVLPKSVGHLVDTASSLGLPRAKEELDLTMGLDVVITSSYSGMKTFECAALQCMDELKKKLNYQGEVKMRSYSATEIDPSARRIIADSKGAGAPMHIFGDILGRVQPAVLQTLKDIETSRLADWEQTKKEFQLGAVDKKDLAGIRTHLGIKMIEEMSEILKTTEFNETDYCFQHSGQCPICPRVNKEFRDSYWVECAGHTCCPWSNMRRLSGGWLDKSTLPFLIWAFSTRFFEPDTILEENVMSFDHQFLTDILNSDGSEVVLKAVTTRPIPRGDDPFKTRIYECVFLDFGPSDLGVPSSRFRKYTAYHLQPFVVASFGVPFESLFFRHTVTDGSIYLVGDQIEIARKNEMLVMQRGRRGHPSSDDDDITLQGALNNSQYKYVEDAMLIAKKNMVDDRGNFTVPMAIHDANQRPAFWKSLPTTIFPAILTKSHFVNLAGGADGEIVPVLSHWLVQGFPHPAVIPHALSRFFPCAPELLDEMTLSDQRVSTGNAMHWAAVGCWFLYNMVSTKKRAIAELQISSAAEVVLVPDSLGPA